jgi:hypothetical protein
VSVAIAASVWPPSEYAAELMVTAQLVVFAELDHDP